MRVAPAPLKFRPAEVQPHLKFSPAKSGPTDSVALQPFGRVIALAIQPAIVFAVCVASGGCVGKFLFLFVRIPSFCGFQMRVLISGDIHIGRRSSKIPENATGFRARDAWMKIVETAIKERVDLVLLSGDVADRDNRFWEAIGPLEAGTSKLAAAGIQTIAVSGNHDFDVLVRLADDLPDEQFRLLGRNGQWERYTVEKGGHTVLHLDGWSFPAEHASASPLDTYQAGHSDGVPVVGLVHGDLAQPTSRYAPLDLRSLETSGADAWVLGHIHAKKLIHHSPSPWILYPGSPQALDPGETGEHGVWVFNVQDNSVQSPEFIPLSTIWYGRCGVDVDGIETRAAFESKVVSAIKQHAQDVRQAMGGNLAAISFRVEITGATALANQVSVIVAGIEKDLQFNIGDAVAMVEKVTHCVTPAINVDDLLRSSSALGVAVQMLKELEDGGNADLIAEAMADLQEADRKRSYRALDCPPPSRDNTNRLLKAQLQQIINQLAGQTS